MDFSYGNKVINASGPLKPSDRNMPGDPRTRVEVFADIANIPTPYVGMTITVLQDETNDNKMTEYKVKSLKANSFGVANSLVDEVVRYVDYLGATSGGGSSSGGASVEIVNDLTTGGANKALSAEQGKVIKSSLDNITTRVESLEEGGSGGITLEDVKTELLGGKINKYLTKEEYDLLSDEEKNDDTIIYNITNQDILDNSDLKGLKFSLVGYNLTLSNQLGEILTTISLQSIAGSGGTVENFGNMIVSLESLTLSPSSTATFTIKLDSAPTNAQTINVSSDSATVTVNPTSVEFNTSNYDVLQTISVTTNSSFENANVTLSNPNMLNKTVILTKETTINPPSDTFVNLIDTSKTEQKSYLDANGQVITTSANECICNNFIEINQGCAYLFFNNSNTQTAYTICEYDENKDHINRTKTATNTYTLAYTPNENARYVKIGINKPTFDDYIFGNTSVQGDVLNKNETTAGYINATDGNIVTTTTDIAFNHVSVDSNLTYTLSTCVEKTLSYVHIGHYDASKVFIKREKIDNMTKPTIITIDTNTKYLRISSVKDYCYLLNLIKNS